MTWTEGLIGLKGWLRREPQSCLGRSLATGSRQPMLQLIENTTCLEQPSNHLFARQALFGGRGLDVFSQKTCLPAHATYNSKCLVIMGKCIIWSVTSWSVDWQFRCSAAPPTIPWAAAARVERKRYVTSLNIDLCSQQGKRCVSNLNIAAPCQSSKIIPDILLGASRLLSSTFSFSLSFSN